MSKLPETKKKVQEEAKEELCPRCEIEGHQIEDCPVPSTLFSALAPSKITKILICDNCGKTGHSDDKCLKKARETVKLDSNLRKDA